MPNFSNILSSPVLIQPGAHDPYTPIELRNLKLDVLFEDGFEHVWLGHYPPFDCLALDLARSTGYRASALLHGRFDVVWCCAAEAFDDNWPIVLDEALRLLGRRGFLVVRFPEFGRMIRMKNLLARKWGVSLRIVDELGTLHGMLAILEVERPGIDALADDAWTVGVLTSGKRHDVVERMLRSVRDGADGGRHEILLFGPRNDGFAPYDVRWLDEAEHGIQPRLNEISRKKNVIAQQASHETLLICHDRYYLQPGFFESFPRFGLDFDIATASQVYEDGQPFPALGAVGGLALDRLDHLSDVSRFVDGAYVNGGFMLVKRALLRAIPLNELCFWNQGEDAEYSVVLRERGVIPRYNALATAVTSGVAKKHCANFRDAFDGVPVLLRYNRGGQSTGLRYHWNHGEYVVSEVHAALPDDEVLALVVDQLAPGSSIAVTLDFRPSEGTAQIEYRVAGGGWHGLAISGDGGPTRLSTLQEAAQGRTVIEFRSRPAPRERVGGSAAARPATIGRFAVVDIRHVRPLHAEFARGSFGRESTGAQAWWWLAAEARLVLLNPNPFPTMARLAFDFQHAAAGGATRLTVPGEAGVDLVGGTPVEPGRFTMTTLLEPGATPLDFASFGAALETLPPGDPRLLSLRLDALRFEPVAQRGVSLTGWSALGRWLPGDVAGTADDADRIDDALLVQAGRAPADRPLFLTLEGRFRAHRRAGERLDLQLGGGHSFKGVEEVDGRVCLRIDPAMRAGSPSLLLVPVDGEGSEVFRVDRLRIDLDEPPVACIATGRRDCGLAPGDTALLGAGDGDAVMLGEGWWGPEPGLRWTKARRAAMDIPIAWPAGQGATLFLDVSTLCAPDLDFAPTMAIRVDGETAHEWQPQTRDRETVAIPLDPAMMAGDRLSVEIVQSAVSSPHALWALGDDRPLGTSVASVRLA